MGEVEDGNLRRIRLYSLLAFASLALIGIIAVGVSGALNSDNEKARVTQASTPTVANPPAPENAKENKKETKKENEKQKATKQENWRQIADQRDADRQAAQRAAAKKQEAAREAAPAVPTSTALNLTVPSAGIQNAPVTDSIAESVLANGAGKLPSTGFPWQSGANTYIAGHVYGYPGTGSWQLFAKVPSMAMGDQIFLTDSNGTTYEYRVSNILTVAPTDVWVVQPTGQTTVSLQTCVGPNWSVRLIVRGTLVETSQA